MTPKRTFKIFISIVIVGFALFILAILFTQTIFFKNWLRDQIVIQANQSLEGELNIGHIRGNLLTSFEIFDISLTNGGETVLHLPRLAVILQPQRLLRKELVIRVIEIDSLRFFLRQLPDSTWNITHLFPGGGEQDTTKKTGSIGWKLSLQGVNLVGADIRIQPLQDDSILPKRIKDINSRISLSYSDSEIAFDLEEMRLKTEQPQLVIDEFSFQISSTEKTVALQKLLLQTSHSRIEGEGIFNLETQPVYEFSLKAMPLDLTDVRDIIPILFLYGAPEIDVHATLQSDSLRFKIDIEEDIQQIRFAGLGESLNTHPKFDIQGHITNLNIGKWLDNPAMNSSINGQITVTGNGFDIDSSRFELTADFREVVFADWNISNLVFTAEYEDTTISGDIKTQGDFGLAVISGKVMDISSSQHYDLEGQFDHINLASISLKDSVSTDLNLHLHAQGSGFQPATMNTDIKISLSPSKVMTVPIDTMFAIAQFSEGQYDIDTLTFNSQVGQIYGSGKGKIDSINNLKFSARLGDLNWLKPYLKADSLKADGYLAGTFSGKPDSFVTNLEYEIADIVYDSVFVDKVGGNANLFWKYDNLNGNADIEVLNSTISNFTINRLGIQTEFTKEHFNNNLSFSFSDSINGKIHSIFMPDSVPRIIIADVEMNVGNHRWIGGSELMQVELGTDYYLFDNIRLSSNDQYIYIDGVFRRDGEENLQIEIGNLDLTIIPELLDTPLNISGLFDMNTYLQGTAEDPIISSHFLVLGGKMNEVGFHDIRANALYEKDKMSLNCDINLNERDALIATAKLPMHLSFSDSGPIFSENYPIDIRIQSDSLNLSLFQDVIAAVKNMKGVLLVDIKVENTLAEPQVSGNFVINDAEIDIPEYGVNYKDFQINIKVDNSRALINRFELKSGGGLLKTSGYVEFGKKFSNLKSAQINTSAQNFLVVKNSDMQIRIKGDINLKGDLKTPQYDGNLTILRSRFYLPAFQKSRDSENDEEIPLLVVIEKDSSEIRKEKTTAPVLIQNLRGNLRINIPRNTWLRGPDMNIEIAGDVDVIKQKQNFEIFGTIRTIRGTYDLYGRRFDIRKGNVAFEGGSDFNPKLELEARYTFRGSDTEKKSLELIITGELFNPTISFTLNDVAITETDAISYLLFGRSSDELTRGEKSQMTQEQGSSGSNLVKRIVSGQLSGQLTNTLRKNLNLDVIEFKGDKNWRQATIVVGKYLTNDLFLSYEREFNVGRSHEMVPEKISLEYEINRFLYLQATQGDEKATGFDLIFKLEK